MSNKPTVLVQKLWNYCNILRDDGLSYGDYVEQLTFLLFLKMADEQSRPPFNKPPAVPKDYAWPSLLARDGDELETHYRHVLESLGKQKGMLGIIFRKAQNKIQDPAKLRRLIVDLIDKEQWSSLSADVKGDAYEGLLQKNAEDVKGGAGQYFTPRPLIAAMVDAIAPQPGQTICDPACGTGGFLLAAHDYIARTPGLDKAQKKRLKNGTLFGIELVDSVTRLCAMNLLLHGIGGTDGDIPISDADLPVVTKDALAGKHGEYDLVLANPPFGKKSSVTIVNEAGEQSKESLIINRDDFWASTSNKQLNFLQHIFTILKQHGRAAVVLPDNVLFEGGAGETIRRELLKQADVHTLLRLPTGIFYAQGVKANVLFFERKPAQEKPWTETLWIYDLRTNKHFTLKESTLKRTDLDDFVACYNPKNRHQRKDTERFKPFTYDELLKRDKVNLDIFWLKDEALEDSANLPSPGIIAQEIADDLEAAVEQFATIAEDVK
ncbi:MAG TPA: class I SAM-dependent DNA methyltransferase [Verrucomicrobiota bacterium]|nr:class I SAM-dependent DNA methyltransferase [Verrucomicrobiota bacterium]HQL78637.1 class I SAM-dependent DNA methyltransferase [Verrucomicrobiota bacterium]